MRHFILAFVIAAAGYAVFYQWIEQRRTSKGPWEILFTNTPTGAPSLVINQPNLAITNVAVSFVDEKTAPATMLGRWLFDQPRPVPFETPFGKCVFADATFLPGSITFEFFGHQVELLPRALIIDHQEHPWLSGQTFNLHSLTNR